MAAGVTVAVSVALFPADRVSGALIAISLDSATILNVQEGDFTPLPSVVAAFTVTGPVFKIDSVPGDVNFASFGLELDQTVSCCAVSGVICAKRGICVSSLRSI